MAEVSILFFFQVKKYEVTAQQIFDQAMLAMDYEDIKLTVASDN